MAPITLFLSRMQADRRRSASNGKVAASAD